MELWDLEEIFPQVGRFLFETKVLGRGTLLFEGTRELEDRYVKTGKVPGNVFRDFVQGDPSPTKKYVEWMCREYSKIPERYGHLIDQVRLFHQYAERNLISNKDIFRYTWEEVEEEIDAAARKQTKSEVKREIKKGATKVAETDLAVAYRIDTLEACIQYGSGTKWCITSVHGGFWNSYYRGSKVVFYFLIPKNPWSEYIFRGKLGGSKIGDLQDRRHLGKRGTSGDAIGMHIRDLGSKLGVDFSDFPSLTSLEEYEDEKYILTPEDSELSRRNPPPPGFGSLQGRSTEEYWRLICKKGSREKYAVVVYPGGKMQCFDEHDHVVPEEFVQIRTGFTED